MANILDHKCPRCGAQLTIKEAVQVLNGSGYVIYVRARTREGLEVIIKAQDANPNEVEILG